VGHYRPLLFVSRLLFLGCYFWVIVSRLLFLGCYFLVIVSRLLFLGYYSVHPRKRRVVLSQLPHVLWASGCWRHEWTLYSRQPLKGTGVSIYHLQNIKLWCPCYLHYVAVNEIDWTINILWINKNSPELIVWRNRHAWSFGDVLISSFGWALENHDICCMDNDIHAT